MNIAPDRVEFSNMWNQFLSRAGKADARDFAVPFLAVEFTPEDQERLLGHLRGQKQVADVLFLQDARNVLDVVLAMQKVRGGNLPVLCMEIRDWSSLSLIVLRRIRAISNLSNMLILVRVPTSDPDIDEELRALDITYYVEGSIETAAFEGILKRISRRAVTEASSFVSRQIPWQILTDTNCPFRFAQLDKQDGTPTPRRFDLPVPLIPVQAFAREAVGCTA